MQNMDDCFEWHWCIVVEWHFDRTCPCMSAVPFFSPCRPQRGNFLPTTRWGSRVRSALSKVMRGWFSYRSLRGTVPAPQGKEVPPTPFAPQKRNQNSPAVTSAGRWKRRVDQDADHTHQTLLTRTHTHTHTQASSHV